MADYEPAPRGMLTQREWRAAQIIRIAAIATLTVLAIVGLLQFLFQIRTILLWVLIGIILAVALQPAVGWLERHRWNRILASLLVSFGDDRGAPGGRRGRRVPGGDPGRQLHPRAAEASSRASSPAAAQLHFLETRFHVLERCRRVTPEQVTSLVAGNQDTIFGVVTKAASIVAATITILTIMVMMLIEGPRAWRSILDDDDRRRSAPWGERVGENFLRATGGYVRGNLAISVVAGIASYIVLKIMGVPYAETLAVLVAVLDVIPLVGATIGAVIVCVVGFALGGARRRYRAGRVLRALPAVREQRAAERRVQQDRVAEPAGRVHRRARSAPRSAVSSACCSRSRSPPPAGCSPGTSRAAPRPRRAARRPQAARERSAARRWARREPRPQARRGAREPRTGPAARRKVGRGRARGPGPGRSGGAVSLRRSSLA